MIAGGLRCSRFDFCLAFGSDLKAIAVACDEFMDDVSRSEKNPESDLCWLS